MDIFDEEILKFWAALQDQKVRYIMVGGYATNLHGYQRYTADIDIWLDDSHENRKRLRTAFIECGMGDYYMLETMQFVPDWTDFHLINGLRLDIMVNMKGLDGYSFDECLKLASIADIDGVQVPFLHMNQLIANKKAVNRPKDQLDVLELERIQKLLRDS
jgi:predicted nucleotidyltransferase